MQRVFEHLEKLWLYTTQPKLKSTGCIDIIEMRACRRSYENLSDFKSPEEFCSQRAFRRPHATQC